MALKSDAKFEEKLTLSSKNDMKNWENWQINSMSSFIKKVQRNHLSWHWKKIQALKKNWLFTWKMTWWTWIWWTLTWTVESLKIFTLMSYFCRKYVMFELKRYRAVVSWKMTYGFKNEINNLVNFDTSNWK